MNEPVMKKPMTEQQSRDPNEYQKLSTPAALSAQQMQSLAKDFTAKLQMIKQDIELRKWAVDQACGLAGTINEQPDGKVTFHDPVVLARQIHAFLVEGAAEKAE
jgi:hypothetical protein